MRKTVSGRYGPVLTGILVALFCFGLLAAGQALAINEPTVNLGLTSFLDGGPPAGPGLYYTQYFQFYTSDKLAGFEGARALPPWANEHLDVYAAVSQFIYQSNQDLLLGGKWGLNFILPIVGLDWSSTAPPPVRDNGAGVGDIEVGPFLQWEPIMGANGPIFMHRIELTAIFPTGSYSDAREINQGSNFFSLDPYWAGTFFITPHWTASWRLHYLWNSENDDPNLLFYPRAHDLQAGQAMHINFASAYEVLPRRLRLGVNGYFLRQFTDDQVNGHSVQNTQEQVLGIGPGAVFHYSKNTHFFANLYFETEAENRTEGTRLILRWVQHF